MAIKVYKPTTNARRLFSVNTHEEVTKRTPERSLCEVIAKSGGRNHHGHTTTRFKGGGARRIYRKIDFRRDKDGIPGKVENIQYDSNRSANIALVLYADGERR